MVVKNQKKANHMKLADSPKPKVSTPVFKKPKFSRNHLIIFAVVFAAIGGYILYRTFAAAPLVASLEAEQMSLPAGASLVTDSTASAGKAMLLNTNGTTSGSVNFPSSVTSLNVIAKGAQCSGSPTMTVKLDSTTLLTNASVSSTSWTPFTITPTTAIASGTHTLTITAANLGSVTHGNSKNVACTRTLSLDVTSFYGPTPPPPPATTATLSATPPSVTAGQSATLTWYSSNATSCTASGAWSGSQPLSGSVSTGALNQTSTYNLSCTGSGGTVNATPATVTVTSSTSLTINGAWYATTSAWNKPIPAGTALRSNSSSLISAFANTWCPSSAPQYAGWPTKSSCVTPAQSGVPAIWIATNATPKVTVQVNDPSISCNSSTMQVPIPSGAVASEANAPEPVMVVMQADTGEEWDFYKITAPGVTPVNSYPARNCAANSLWQTVSAYHYSPGWTGSGSLGSQGTRASGTPLGSGVMRPRDWQAAAGSTWDHALAIAYTGTLPHSFVYPATVWDGNGAGCTDTSTSTCVPEGARFQLDPSINCSTWPSLQDSAYGGNSAEFLRQLCRTLQKYGMIVVDNGAGLIAEHPISAESTNVNADPPHNGQVASFNRYPYIGYLPSDLVARLQVIDWSVWTGQ